VLIFGVLTIALTSGLIVTLYPILFVVVFLLDLWLLGYHHVISTFTKLAGTKSDRAENSFLIYQLPILVLAGVIGLYLAFGIWSVVTIYFFWQWYHYTRQSYGIATFYRKKAQNPVPENKHIALATLWCVPIWGVLNRCAEGWDKFLFLPVWMPPIPGWIPMIAGIISVGLIAYWAVNVLRASTKGTIPLGHTMFMISHFTVFYVGYVLTKEINTGWLVANIWHNAQYVLFVWLYNRRRFTKMEGYEKNWLAWASQPGPMRVLAYFAGCLALTTIFYGVLTVGIRWFAAGNKELILALFVVSFQTLNFHHYVVDSKIWKARKKQHQVVMEIKQPAA